MLQRITWTATLDVDTDGLNWEEATRLAKQQMAETSEAYVGKVIRLEIVEDEA